MFVIELADNGYDMLIAYAVGPGNIGSAERFVDDEGFTPSVGTHDGRRLHRHSAQDMDIIEDVINGYLADAQIPPRPRGRRWFLLLPRPCTRLELERLVASVEDRMEPPFRLPCDAAQRDAFCNAIAQAFGVDPGNRAHIWDSGVNETHG